MKVNLMLIALVILLLSLSLIGVAMAAGGPEISWHVFGGGGGGGGCSAGQTCLQGTFGQPVAGYASNGNLSIGSGFWYGIPRELQVYLPFIVR
jgi:hypothetical protein